MPELVVDLIAIRKKQYEIAIDAIGSCLVDACFSIGIGPLAFGQITVSRRLAETPCLYALFSSIIVVLALALRGKLDKKLAWYLLFFAFLHYIMCLVISGTS